ncbi:beta-N-acetylglucosaminidase domain-containing protein [Sphingomonas sp. ac-8]|uniref:beta-N-acetylhexosaminidase family protein n=1 Tax=Sphingomonas sp. ac-8 TaxID=3242977 RepID=UPI003A80C02C
MPQTFARPTFLLATAAAALLVGSAHATPLATLPAVFPQPVSMALTGPVLDLGREATLVDAGADAATVALVRDALAAAGVETIRTARSLPGKPRGTVVVLGTADAGSVRAAVTQLGGTLPDQREGYALLSGTRGNAPLVVLAGHDGDGLYYAAHTLRQLTARGTMPSVRIADAPSMAIRGTIEGFYGAPWSMQDRAAHLDFLGSVKANTYIYSPKDDPFARDKWREAYPQATLDALKQLVDQARRHHVRFTYAISPGPSICYSDPADVQALQRKFDAFRAMGVRSFYIAFDDIEYKKWNCDADRAALGEPGERAAGLAQAQLSNSIYHWLKGKDGADAELMIVPTEYYNTTESPYKAALRQVDPAVYVQWTGTDVVPPAISIGDAKAATKAFGRKTLLWDNYPVNDYGESSGRLLMAPYAKRQAGLSDELSGILANPMNQEAPSRVAVFGSAAFAWNDRGYDADRAWKAAARMLASDDAATTAALMTFFDVEHLAPTFGSQPWQPAAPRLKATLDGVAEALANGTAEEREQALARLKTTADDLATAPDTIRAGVADAGFVAQSKPWLDALQLWGRSLQATANGLSAAERGNSRARGFFAQAQALAAQAEAIQTIPNTTRPQGSIKIADGVLDRFVREAPSLIYVPTAAAGGD